MTRASLALASSLQRATDPFGVFGVRGQLLHNTVQYSPIIISDQFSPAQPGPVQPTACASSFRPDQARELVVMISQGAASAWQHTGNRLS